MPGPEHSGSASELQTPGGWTTGNRVFMRSGAQKCTGRRRERALPSANMLEFKASSLTAHRGASGREQQRGEGPLPSCPSNTNSSFSPEPS